MKNYAETLTATPQTDPIPGSGQVPNSAGGYAWQVTPWQLLDRFLILGTEGGTYYIQEPKLTVENITNVMECIREDGPRVVNRIVEISQGGRAVRQDPAIFALAVCGSKGTPETRKLALEALPSVCRTGTHLFQFAAEIDKLRGWGRGLRRAIGNWYNQAEVQHATYQAIKYQQRGGWSHGDLLRLAHPKPATPDHAVLYKWIVDHELTGENARLAAFEALKVATDAAEAARLIREHDLPRECVPTGLLNTLPVWEALLERMPLTAMVRNLGNMTKNGLLTIASEGTTKVLAELANADRIRASRIHPIQLLLARLTYAQGRGSKGDGTWTTVPRIVDALDQAFYMAFQNVVPTNKRYLLGIDVSSSMRGAFIGSTGLTAAVASGAMAMVTLRSEQAVYPMGFSTEFKHLDLTPNMSLSEVMAKITGLNFGGTDCSLPMTYAQANKLEIDTFVVYTDSETYAGKPHPSQALANYRRATGIPAKLVVVGMTANRFTIADPRDPGMMDFPGFDSGTPQAISAFAAQ